MNLRLGSSALCIALLAVSTQVSAWGLKIPMIAEGDIVKHFYLTYSGEIDRMQLVRSEGHKVYEMTVKEANGDTWIYHYSALTGKLLSKHADFPEALELERGFASISE